MNAVSHYQLGVNMKSKIIYIIIALTILFFGGVLGFWFGSGSKFNSDENLEDYIDSNLERLKTELECIMEQRLVDVQTLKELTDYINLETEKLNVRLKQIGKYTEVLNETNNLVDRINFNIDRFRPDR